MENERKEYLHFDPKEMTILKFQGLMQGAIAPRPIAFASTIDKDGKPNLSPFSFFNAFGTNPPILVFSPSRRGRDNTTKHTYENVKEVPEVVINVVNFDMVQQVSDASAEFPKGVNEFEMVGFTMQKSEIVKPYRVLESPVQFECKVLQVIETGTQNAAGNLVICEILRMHINPGILDESGNIDPHKLDLVGRLGRNFYVRASGNAIFEVAKPD
jgi:flavin reductase (DIM6/NTAB) family NADH-FMN oxidoreductase RutF